MPNRMVRTGINRSHRVNRLDWASEVFYRRLFSIVDDYGIFELDFDLLVSDIYPLKRDRVSKADVAKWWLDCVNAALVSEYKAQGGVYGVILNFRQHVRTKSKFPMPTENSGLTVIIMEDPEDKEKEKKKKYPIALIVRTDSPEFKGIHENSNEFNGIHVNDLYEDGDEDEDGGVNNRASSREKKIREVQTVKYPASIEEVQKIASSPLCGMPMSREQADAYLTDRIQRDWIPYGQNRQLRIGSIPADVKKWLLRDQNSAKEKLAEKNKKEFFQDGKHLSSDPKDFSRRDEL